VTRGLLGFRALGTVPEHLHEGDVIRIRLLFFHLIPAWTHEIRIIRVDEQERTVATAEHGGAVRRWDHVLRFEAAGAGRSRYTDTIELEAGALTPLIWAYAQLFYRYRQMRWRRLARSGQIT
jgi:hypothetical protein